MKLFGRRGLNVQMTQRLAASPPKMTARRKMSVEEIRRSNAVARARAEGKVAAIVSPKPAAEKGKTKAPAVRHDLLTAAVKVFGSGAAYAAIRAGHRTPQTIHEHCLTHGHVPVEAKRGDATAELLSWATKSYGASDAMGFYQAGARTRDGFRVKYAERYKVELDALDGTPQARAAFALSQRELRLAHARELRAKARADAAPKTLSGRQRKIALDLISTGVPASVARRVAAKEKP